MAQLATVPYIAKTKPVDVAKFVYADRGPRS